MCETTTLPQDMDSAVGAEVRNVRLDLGWGVSKLARQVPGLTLADLRGQEGGRYKCGLLHVVTLCQIMAVPAPDLLALAMQRLHIDLEMITLQVDLHAVATAVCAPRFWPLRRWAQLRLVAGQHRHGIVRIERHAAVDIANRLQVDPNELVGYLARKPPASVRGSATCETRGAPDPEQPRPTMTKSMLGHAIGIEMQAIRAEQGRTAGDLAARLPLSVGLKSVYGYESGGVPDSVPRLIELGRALTVPGPELLDRALRRLDALN